MAWLPFHPERLLGAIHREAARLRDAGHHERLEAETVHGYHRVDRILRRLDLREDNPRQQRPTL